MEKFNKQFERMNYRVHGLKKKEDYIYNGWSPLNKIFFIQADEKEEGHFSALVDKLKYLEWQHLNIPRPFKK